MKRDAADPMRTLGSLTLCRSLLQAGLVDRFRVVVFPVIEIDDVALAVVFEHEAAGAGAERLENVLVEVEGRQDQDPGGGIRGEDPGPRSAAWLDTLDAGGSGMAVSARRGPA